MDELRKAIHNELIKIFEKYKGDKQKLIAARNQLMEDLDSICYADFSGLYDLHCK